MTILKTNTASYTIYIDGCETWLQIKQLEEEHYAYVEVEKFYNLLLRGGELELDEKKSSIKTLIFNLSNMHLRSEHNYINTYLTNKKGYMQKLKDKLGMFINEELCSAEKLYERK